MSKNLLWGATLLMALGVGYGLGAESRPSPAPTPAPRADLAPSHADYAPLTPQAGRESKPIEESGRPPVAASPSPELEPTSTRPPVAVALEAFPPAREPDQTAAALMEAILAVLPTKKGDDEFDRVQFLGMFLRDLRRAVPKEHDQALQAAAFRLLPDRYLLPNDPEVAFALARETYQAAPDKNRLGLLAGALRKLAKSRKLTPAERTLLESLALEHPGHEGLEVAMVQVDPAWGRHHLARDGWTPSDALRLARGEGPLAEEAAFEVLTTAGLVDNALSDAYRLAPKRTLELIASMGHDPAWVREGTMLRFHMAESAQDKLRIFEQTWELMSDREVLIAVWGLRDAAGRRGPVTWSPTMTQAAKRVIRADGRPGAAILRVAPASLRVELLGAQTRKLLEWEQVGKFMEFLSEYPFVARAQLPSFLALFPVLKTRQALELAATFQRMGDPQSARQVLDAMDSRDPDAEAARTLLERGGWLFDLVD